MASGSTVAANTVVTRSDHCLAIEVDHEYVMMDVEGGVYFGLDRIGTDIWNLLENPRRVTDLCAELERRYAAPLDVITADVCALLDRLIDEGLASVQA